MQRTVLITGAGSGLGLASVEALASRGADVVATVRKPEDADLVQARMGVLRLDVRTALLDITDADSARSVVERFTPDVVVNNAGRALLGRVLDASDDDVAAQMELEVLAPIRLARLAIDRAQRDGRAARIVNVSSVLQRQPLPMTGWYAAAKAALAAVTEALRAEAPEGVEIVLVELGAVDTPAWAEAAGQMAAGDDEERRWGEVTKAARPLFTDAAVAAGTVADAALGSSIRTHRTAGFGRAALGVLPLLPAPVRDAALRAVLTEGG